MTDAKSNYFQRGLSQQTTTICELWNKGLTYKEIFNATGIPMPRIYSAIRRANIAGVELQPKAIGRLTARKLNYIYEKPIGSIYQCIEQMPSYVAVWLMETTPAGMTVAEYISAFVVDAFNEETTS